MTARRVLHVVEVTHGGVVSYVRDIIAEQSDRGQDVHVLAPPGVLDTEQVSAHAWSVRRNSPRALIGASRAFRETVRSVRPDVVHLHSFFPGVLGRLRPVPPDGGARPRVVYQPHSWAFNATSRGMLRKAWERWAARRTDAVVCVSAGEVDEGLRAGFDRLPAPVGSPVNVRHFHPVEETTRDEWRKRLGVRGRRLLVCVGRICRQKGQDLLLRAWSADPIPDTELVLVGPGELGSLYRQPVPDGVRAVGSTADVRPWLWAADLIVLSSRYEANSLAIGEAMACGRPVLATEVAGADSIGSGESMPAGQVVPPEDVDALLAECRRRFDDPDLVARESRNARERAVERFAVPAVVDRLERLYGLARTAAPGPAISETATAESAVAGTADSGTVGEYDGSESR